MSVRYAFRVRGSRAVAVVTAQQAGLTVEPMSATTTISGRFRDQAALFGSLARLRLLGLEVIDVRRLPRVGDRPDASHSPSDAPSSPG